MAEISDIWVSRLRQSQAAHSAPVISIPLFPNKSRLWTPDKNWKLHHREPLENELETGACTDYDKFLNKDDSWSRLHPCLTDGRIPGHPRSPWNRRQRCPPRAQSRVWFHLLVRRLVSTTPNEMLSIITHAAVTTSHPSSIHTHNE